MAAIQFGTSGWRAILAEEFTFRNVEIVARAIAGVLKEDLPPDREPSVVIGYDGRFLADSFARACALAFAEEGVKALLPQRPTPTPMISFLIGERRLGGGIMLTASHNPPEYGGIKFNPANGAPAAPDVTKRIEARANALDASLPRSARFPASRSAQAALVAERVQTGTIEFYEPYNEYRAHVFRLVDVDALRRAKLTVVADAFYGAGRGYLPQLLEEVGCNVTRLHDEPNPLFGGTRPDPTAENVGELAAAVRDSGAVLGLAVDGDADRFGIVDADGSYIHANHILALLTDYLVQSRKWRGFVVRSFATSSLLDMTAAHHGLEAVETPTGFKFIGERFLADPDAFILGGEESNGVTIRRNVPEKDGLIACLLVAEMVAARGESVQASLANLFDRVGERHVDRLDLELAEAKKQALLKRLKDAPPKTIGEFVVDRLETLDGFKFILNNGGWIAVRPSGTEPLVRCYLDAPSRPAMEAMQRAARELVDA